MVLLAEIRAGSHKNISDAIGLSVSMAYMVAASANLQGSLVRNFSRECFSGNMITARRNLGVEKCAATTSSDSSKPPSAEQAKDVPEWAKPGSDVPPPWAGGEKAASLSTEGFDLPYIVYLLASSLVAIAAVGSIFEYFNKNPIFGVIQPDSPFYTPILGFFSITGLPVSAFLWLRAIKLANKDAERQDREDGYM